MSLTFIGVAIAKRIEPSDDSNLAMSFTIFGLPTSKRADEAKSVLEIKRTILQFEVIELCCRLNITGRESLPRATF